MIALLHRKSFLSSLVFVDLVVTAALLELDHERYTVLLDSPISRMSLSVMMD